MNITAKLASIESQMSEIHAAIASNKRFQESVAKQQKPEVIVDREFEQIMSVDNQQITKAQMREYVGKLNNQVWYKKTMCRVDAITPEGNQRRLYFVPGLRQDVEITIMKSRVVAIKHINGETVARKIARI